VILQRHLILEELRNFDVKYIKELNPHILDSFCEQDKEGNVIELCEINWEYALFTAPLKELIYLMERLLTHRHERIIEANNTTT